MLGKISKLLALLLFSTTLVLVSFSSNTLAYGGLIKNGDFESGHTSWDEYYYDGSTLTPVSNIIVNGNNGGSGNYYAYLYAISTARDALFNSDNFILPNDIESLTINYDSKFRWGANSTSCDSGNNLSYVGLWDVTANESAGTALINDANDPDDTQYNTHITNLGSGLSSRAGHEFYISFLFLNDDPNCEQLLYLDNVSLHAGTPVYRFYNFKQGAHFYTSNFSEYKNVKNTASHTFRYEGVSYSVRPTMVSGTSPVHRFYNFKQGVHFFTSNQAEATNINNTASHTFRYEGVSYYAFK